MVKGARIDGGFRRICRHGAILDCSAAIVTPPTITDLLRILTYQRSRVAIAALALAQESEILPLEFFSQLRILRNPWYGWYVWHAGLFEVVEVTGRRELVPVAPHQFADLAPRTIPTSVLEGFLQRVPLAKELLT